MFILQRHYLKEFLKLFSLLGIGLALIFSILELIENIDEFIPNKPSLENLSYYVFLNFPKYLIYLLPAAMLICSLFIFSQAARNKEIIALKATGGRLKALFYPFIITGIMVSIFAFIVEDIVVPDFTRRSNELKRVLMNKGKKITFQEGTLWLIAKDGSLVRVDLYVPEKKLAKGISIFVIHDDLLSTRIEAEEAEWSKNYGDKGMWKLKNVIIYDIEHGKTENKLYKEYPALESPDFFNEGVKKPEEMGAIELYRYIDRVKRSGFKDNKLIVDFNSKLSYPLINLFMILLGVALSTRGKIGGGLVVAGLGVLISAIYWFIYTLMLSMGFAGVLPPIIAAWLVPVVFGMISVHLFRNIPE
jgi:lipopolysaccharide export system permease protein